MATTTVDDADQDREDQRLGVGARRDDDALTLVEQVLREGHGADPLTRRGRDVHDIAGADGDLGPPSRGDHEPAARRDAGRAVPVQHVAGWAGRPGRRGRAWCTARRTTPQPGPHGRRLRRPARRRTPAAGHAAGDQQVGAVDVAALLRRSRWRSRRGSSARVSGHVQADPDDRRRARRWSRRARPAAPPSCGSPRRTSLGHFSAAVGEPVSRRARATATPVSSGSQGQATGLDLRPQQHREGERRPGRGRPGAVEATAAGGLVLGDDDETLRRSRPGPVRDQDVGRGRRVDHLDVVRRRRGPAQGGAESLDVERRALGSAVNPQV